MSDFGEIQDSGDGGFSRRPDQYQQYDPSGDMTGASAGGPPPGALAGFWIRLAATLLDGILLGILGGVLTFPVGDAGSTVLQAAVAAVYFVFLHSTKAGQTPGMRVCGIRLVDESSGGQVEPGKAFLRWVMSYVSAIPLALGYLWMLWDPKSQTWHDKVASTLVVYSKMVPAPTTSLVER